jgi:tRNA A37 threonylcarbamoyladenosine dehydratase
MTTTVSDAPVPAVTDRRFGGIARLYGVEGLQRFREAHVCVVGIGGVGSWAVEALARSAVGTLTLIDLDNVAESNVNRQIHALDGAFGKAKVEAMAERIGAINPSCRVIQVEDFVTLDNVAELIRRDFDWVLDCMDAFRIKAALAADCRRHKIKLVTVGAAGGMTDPTRIKVLDLSRTAQDPLLARTRKQLRDRHGFPTNPQRRFSIPAVFSDEHSLFPSADGGVCQQRDPGASASGLNCAGGIGSVMTVTASFGLVAVSLVLNRLAGRLPKGYAKSPHAREEGDAEPGPGADA